MSSPAAARALSRAVKPRAPPARRDASSRAGGRASETLEVARGGLPRFPACAWRAPGAGAERGIPVGAYVCAEAATVQRVRAALLDTGRLKPHGVTRFDARAWGVFGARSDHPEDAADATDLARPGAASWAVHVFGLPPGARENDAIAALVAAGETRYLPGLRMGSPACYLDGPSPRAGDSDSDSDSDPDPAPFPLGAFAHPIASPEARAAALAERRALEASARPGGVVSPPRWAPAGIDGGAARPRSFTFSELFAGAGGFGLALRDLGGAAVFASEICPHARRTYILNHGVGSGTGAPGDGPLVVGDVTNACASLVPPHDVLTAGFPCQSFSRRGDRRGLDDPRGALYLEISRVLAAARPRAFILENVEGLVEMDGGRALETVLASFRGAGYETRWRTLDAWGWVPQRRARVFFVGFRDDLGGDPGAKFRWPEQRDACGGAVADVLEEEAGNAATEAGEVSERQLERAKAFFAREGNARGGGRGARSAAPPIEYLAADVGAGGVARTLVASYRKSSAYNAELVPPPPAPEEGEEEAPGRRLRPRYYTAREAARLQGFPEWFQPDPERAHHEIGNSVAVPLVRDIAAAVLKALEGSEGEAGEGGG